MFRCFLSIPLYVWQFASISKIETSTFFYSATELFDQVFQYSFIFQCDI